MLWDVAGSESGGEGGIRTLVGAVLPIRFRVGAVITASVPLQKRHYTALLFTYPLIREELD
jgi:hypothetical protein